MIDAGYVFKFKIDFLELNYLYVLNLNFYIYYSYKLFSRRLYSILLFYFDTVTKTVRFIDQGSKEVGPANVQGICCTN